MNQTNQYWLLPYHTDSDFDVVELLNTTADPMPTIVCRLLASSRKYNPQFEVVPNKMFFSKRVWMKAKPVSRGDFALYATLPTVTEAFNKILKGEMT